MLLKLGNTFFMMVFFEIKQLGHGMVNYYTCQVCPKLKALLIPPRLQEDQLEDMICDVGT